MAEGIGIVTQYLPSGEKITSWASSVFKGFTWFILVLIILTACGVFAYLFIKNLKYRNRIVIWEKINGKWEVTGRDKAMELKYGAAGDILFLLKKRKIYRPRPELQTGRRTYWYAIREDGEWINITMEDIDLAMKQARVKFLHSEMRYARTQIQKGLRERHEKQKWLEKYGHIVFPLLGFIIIAVFLWFFMDKYLVALDKLNVYTGAAKEVMDLAKQVLSSVANIKAGSGYVAGG